MKNIQSLLLMLLIFLAVGGVNAVLGLLVFSYALISEFWFVIFIVFLSLFWECFLVKSNFQILFIGWVD